MMSDLHTLLREYTGQLERAKLGAATSTLRVIVEAARKQAEGLSRDDD